jgi:signal transduction histidine kinase
VLFFVFQGVANDSGSAGLIFFVFVAICATLRWASTGALLTAVATILLLGAFEAYTFLLTGFGFPWVPYLAQSAQMASIAALLGFLGTYPYRLQSEMSRVAQWPRRMPRDSRVLVTDILTRSAQVFECRTVVMAWEEPESDEVSLAWSAPDGTAFVREPRGALGELAGPGLENKSFQAANVRDEHGRVVVWADGWRRQRRCRAVGETLAARFDMTSVQSSALDGEFVRGRLFWIGMKAMQFDDLIVGDLAARLAASQLDSLYLTAQMGAVAVAEERLRVARDLHDSLAQSLAGTALQLLAGRRLLDFNPPVAKSRLAEVQYQLKRDQLELRSLIKGLRPPPRTAVDAPAPPPGRPASLRDRLDELKARIRTQWDVGVDVEFRMPVEDWPKHLVEQVYLLVREGALNAARHADASVIRIVFRPSAEGPQVEIEDDGKGFPFQGSYDLAALNRMNEGPLTLRERVTALKGGMQVVSSSGGSRVTITLPHTVAAH